MIGTASAAKLDLIRESGLSMDLGIDRASARFADAVRDHTDGHGCDVILDTVGAPYWNDRIRPQVSAAAHYQGDEAADEAYRGQGVVARLAAPTGATFSGASALVSTGGGPRRHAVLRDNVAQHGLLTLSRRGRDQYPNSPMGAVALARQALYDAHGLPPDICSHAWRESIPVYLGAVQVGYATSGTWSPTLKKSLALATVQPQYAKPDTELRFEWTVEHERKTVRAKVARRPFFDPARKRGMPEEPAS